MDRINIQIPQKPFLLDQRYAQLIILQYQLMQFVKSQNEIVEIWENVLGKTERCTRVKEAKIRDSLRELILFAYRKGLLDSLINHCENLYPQINLKQIQLTNLFQWSKNERQFQQINQLPLEEGEFKETLTEILAQLSNDDLHQLAFLLGTDIENIGYSGFVNGSVNFSQRTSDELKLIVENQALRQKRDPSEIEAELRKIYAEPTEEEMRKILTKANIPNKNMDFLQMQYQLKILFIENFINVFEHVRKANNILTAYLQL